MKKDADVAGPGQGFDGNPAKEPQLPPPQGREKSEMSDGALTPRDAPTVFALPESRVRNGNIEMAHMILDAYERGDDRNLVNGWAVRLATHLLALDAIAGDPRGVSESQSSHRTQGRESVIGPDTIYEAIKHGDEEHRAWLREALNCLFAGKPVPPVRALDHSRRVSTRGEIESDNGEARSEDAAPHPHVPATKER